jgi:hypothetical protein
MTMYTLNYENVAGQRVEADGMDEAIWLGSPAAGRLAYGKLKSVELGGKTYWMAEFDPANQPEEVAVAPETPAKLPSRRLGGMTLSYDDDTCTLWVNMFGYSASLACVENEGDLSWMGKGYREDYTLTAKQMKIVALWSQHEDEYYAKNKWAYRVDCL